MFKKQTAVSHRSTESEVVSLVAGLRMDGITALDLWDLVIDVLQASPKPIGKGEPPAMRLQCAKQSKIRHAKKCVEWYCELAIKYIEQVCEVSTPCIDHQNKKRELETVRNLSNFCSQIVLKCLYLPRIGRPDTVVCEQTGRSSHEMDESM